jgi:hypothetical protein
LVLVALPWRMVLTLLTTVLQHTLSLVVLAMQKLAVAAVAVVNPVEVAVAVAVEVQ